MKKWAEKICGRAKATGTKFVELGRTASSAVVPV
jgi:hypothetical protein